MLPNFANSLSKAATNGGPEAPVGVQGGRVLGPEVGHLPNHGCRSPITGDRHLGRRGVVGVAEVVVEVVAEVVAGRRRGGHRAARDARANPPGRVLDYEMRIVRRYKYRDVLRYINTI